VKYKFIEKIKENKWILSIMVFALIWRLGVLIIHGPYLSLNSDDGAYVTSARVFLEKFMLVYHDPETPTVHIMPGQVVLLSIIFGIFGFEGLGYTMGKLLFIGMGVLNVYLVYLIGKTISNKAI